MTRSNAGQIVQEIADGVFEIVCDVRGFAYRAFLFDGMTPTLFDTGWADTTAALFSGIETIGTEPERVIITHGDPDHIGGLAAVEDRFTVETWLPEQTVVADGSLVDNRFTDGDRIGPFRAIHVPGHAPDLHAFIDEDRGILVTGDAVNGSDVRGLPPGGFVLPPAVFSDDLNQAEESLERLLGDEFHLALVSHGSIVTDHARDVLEAFVFFPGHPDRR